MWDKQCRYASLSEHCLSLFLLWYSQREATPLIEAAGWGDKIAVERLVQKTDVNIQGKVRIV